MQKHIDTKKLVIEELKARREAHLIEKMKVSNYLEKGLEI